MKDCDYYCTLEIDQTASPDQIRTAYRKLARRFHPDVTSDTDGENKFKAVGEAYKTLHHPEARQAYNLQQAKTRRSRKEPWEEWISCPPDLRFALFPWPVFTWLWWH
ncbi:MAG: DnaJ domain-containing protein [Azonexus sp.]